jgi:type II secretory pathway predicted ATPase ExeA
MIRSYFGIKDTPFSLNALSLLPQQEDIFEMLKVHAQQGGFCVILGEPGTGKSVLKQALCKHADQEKRSRVVTLSRTLHTYWNMVQLLCESLKINAEGSPFKNEKGLVLEAQNLNRNGKTLVTIVDDAHLLEIESLKRLRLLFEDFPKNHNLILIGLPSLLMNLNLRVHEEIKSRLTYSAMMKRLNFEDLQAFVLKELSVCGLGPQVFTEEALHLVAKSAEGILRKCRNLALSCLLESVRHQTRQVTLEIVNSVLIQPHWRKETEFLVPDLREKRS